MPAAAWEPIAARKQAQRDALIPSGWRLKQLPPASRLNVTDVPRESGILSARELDITDNYDATALAEAIRRKTFTCVEVTTAYCKRAAIAQQVTNCLTEIMFDAALRRAEFLDHQLRVRGETVGPLHGVPISVKDSFKVAGVDASIGLAAFCFRPAADTAHLVNVLLRAGAVVHCKTNIPQLLSTLDSTNNIFGRVLNPLNRLCTAGGSTGGEGALLAMRGSALGVGTDIGGSIRVPAMCNGLYGVKPSANRVPYGGQTAPGPEGSHGAVGLTPSAGPLARSLRDCELFLRAVAAARPWEVDPSLVPGVWESASLDLRANPSGPTVTIGVLASDGLVTPLPPIARLLGEVSAALSASAGVAVVALPTPPSLAGAQSLSNKLMGLEGGNNAFDLLERYGEPLIPWLDGRMKRRPAATLAAIHKLHAQREAVCAELGRQLWRDPLSGRPIDAVVCPVAPHPTPRIDDWVGVGYTIDWVMTDYPAGTLPVRELVESDLDGEMDPQAKEFPKSGWDANTQKLWPARREDRRHFLGTSLCVQVLAPRLQEKRLVRCMEVIDQALKESRAASGAAPATSSAKL